MTSASLTLSLWLPAVAWSGESFDSALTELQSLAPAQLVDLSAIEAGVDPTIAQRFDGLDSISGLLVAAIRFLRETADRARRAGRTLQPEVVTYVSTTPGDASQAPRDPGARSAVAASQDAVVLWDDCAEVAVVIAALIVSDEVLRWQVRIVGRDGRVAQPIGAGQAGAELTTALADATSEISRLTADEGSRSWDSGLVPEQQPEPITHPRTPDSLPDRAGSLLERSDFVEGIVELATRNGIGNAVSSREPVLRALAASIARARSAAIFEHVRRTIDRADRHLLRGRAIEVIESEGRTESQRERGA